MLLGERADDERADEGHGRGDEQGVLLFLLGSDSLGRDVLARMLRNLKEIHRSAEDWPLRQALNQLQGKTVVASKTAVERKAEAKTE